MEILNSLIRENNISFLRISIVDILGEKRSIEFPASALKDIYNNLVKCDGSSLCGIGTADNSDRVICLDENSHYFISDNTLEIFGFLQEENEETTVFDPREILNKQIKILNSKGYFLNVGIEPEFYIVDEETLDPIDDGTYFSIRQDQKSTYLRKICVENLLKRNFNVSSFHHEVGPGQNEINYLFSDPMSIADTFYIYKETIKETALKNKCIATFLPKPFKGLPGSGMHINCSIWNFKKKNMFYDETNEHHFSDFGINFTNGILRHIKALTALSATIDNSYLRLHSGLESPSGIFYSFNDREAAIRIPSTKQSRTRIELRFVDSTAQLYLLLAGIISAGIDGLEHPLRKGDENDILPKGLLESLKYLEEDEILNNCFGRKIIQKYIYEKKKEKIVPFRKLVMDY